MFKTFINAFKIKDIRKKLLYTLLMMVIIRIGSQIPIPGVDATQIQALMEQLLGGGDGGILMAITGGSLERMSILALGITPYITSSIVMQLLTIAIPPLEEMQRDGEDGRKKIAAITRYLTVALALIESGAMAIGYKSLLGDNYNALGIICVIAAMTVPTLMNNTNAQEFRSALKKAISGVLPIEKEAEIRKVIESTSALVALVSKES